MQLYSKKLATDSHATLYGYIQRRDDSTANTTWPAVIVIPGGSYTHIPEAQAEALTLAFNRLGFQGFYLDYTNTTEHTPLLPRPLVELAKAVAEVKANAADWHIDPDRIVIAGFSVGGHIAALYNDYWATDWLSAASDTTVEQRQIQAVMLGYPVISPSLGFPKDAATLATWTDEPAVYAAEKHVTEQNQPTFIWATTDDPIVPSKNARAYVNALADQGIDTEFHLFHHGPHGLALADETTAWNSESLDWHAAHWLPLFNEWYHALS